MAEDGWTTKQIIVTGLVAPLVTALATPLVEKLLGSVGFSFGLLTWISESTLAVFTFKLPVWIVCLAFVIGWSLYRTWRRFAMTTAPSAEDVMSDFKTAMILGIRWSWGWNRLHKAPTELQEICPECGMQLTLEEWYEDPPPTRDNSSRPILNPGSPDGSKVQCEKCGFTETWDKKPEDLKQFVLKEIVRLANTGEWMEKSIVHKSLS